MSEPDNLTPEQSARARELLEQGARVLDAHTVQRLQRVRAAALRGELPRRVARPAWLTPAAGLAVAASLVFAVVVLLPTAPEHSAPGVASVEDIEILFAKDDLNLYEDLEFYAWLDEEPG
jgi:hypothetical protein